MKKVLGRHWNRLTLSLTALGASVSMAAVPQVSPVTLGSLEAGKPVDAKLSVNLNGQQLECSGKVTLASFSILTCGGEQRLAQVEFQSFNENKDAVVAVYQSGNQEGYLYLAKLEGQAYALNTQQVVITPGFGSVKLFSKYIYEPMKSGGVSDAQMFTIIPQMAEGLGVEFKLASLRDRVANREYTKFVVADEPKAETKVEVKEEVKSETKQEEKKSEEPVVKDPAVVKVEDQKADDKKDDKKEDKKTEEPKKERNLLPKEPIVQKDSTKSDKKKDEKKSTPSVKPEQKKPKKQIEDSSADPNEIVVDRLPPPEGKQTDKNKRQNRERPQQRLTKRERQILEKRRKREFWENERREALERAAEERAYQRERDQERLERLRETPSFQSESDDLFGVPDWE